MHSSVLRSNPSQEFANLRQLFCVLTFSIVSARNPGSHVSLGWVSCFDTIQPSAKSRSQGLSVVSPSFPITHTAKAIKIWCPSCFHITLKVLPSRIPKNITMEKPAVARGRSKWIVCALRVCLKLSARTRFCTDHQYS
jgi:hypothetical protein